MKKFTSPSQKIGQLGENVAYRYLMNNGFCIVECNFTRKCGEIDVIACKDGITHFIEVKSVSCENFERKIDEFRPEDQMHPWKQKRLMRTIETYLLGHEIADWQCDLICVFLNTRTRKARVKTLEDIILE